MRLSSLRADYLIFPIRTVQLQAIMDGSDIYWLRRRADSRVPMSSG